MLPVAITKYSHHTTIINLREINK